MIALFLGIAFAAPATLHVGVHVAAGSVYDIAADGASGMCTVGPSRISCPADGPVTFRWGPGGPWTLDGQTVVAPGEVGVAFVLASEEARVAERERLAARPLLPETVRALFLRTGATEAPAPSRRMIEDLLALTTHPDPKVRRAVVDALIPFWRHTASDPFPPSAPALVPENLIGLFAEDQDVGVRRRMAARLKDLGEPGDSLAAEAREALVALVGDDRASVQRAATASIDGLARAEEFPAALSWDMALDNVLRPGPAGRAAANTLAHLRPFLEPGVVDPGEAVLLTLTHHPERAWSVWGAWREEVPFRRDWVDTLLRDTVGLERRLIRTWAEKEPFSFADALSAWEPAAPHSERFGLVRSWLSDTEHAAMRLALGLPELPPTD